MKNLTFASLAYENKKKKTRRELFLEEMNEVIPWSELLQVVEKYYPPSWQWTSTNVFGKDAEDLLYATMVWFIRPGHGRRPLRY
jgi:hypothetical protein